MFTSSSIKIIRTSLLLAFSLAAMFAFGNSEFPIDEDYAQEKFDAKTAPQVIIPLQLDVKKLTRLVRSEFYLADIASCKGEPTLCSEVLNVRLGQSPKPSKSMVYDRARLVPILEAEFEHYKFELTGAKRVRIESIAAEIERDVLYAHIKDKLDALFKEKNDLQIRSVVIQRYRPLQVWPDDFELRIPLLEDANLNHLDWVVDHLVGRKNWEIQYVPHSDEAKTLSFQVSLNIIIEQNIPVTRNTVRKETILKHEHLKYQWVALSRRNIGGFKEIKDVVGLKATRNLPSGSVVSDRQVELPLMVGRGELVKMRIINGQLTVNGAAKALDSGGLGQSIRIYYPATKKRVHARIVGKSLVEVAL